MGYYPLVPWKWQVDGARALTAVLKRAKERDGLTQAKLCRAMKVSDATISRWASGERVPDANALATLCREIPASADELLGLPRNAMSKRAFHEARRLLETAERDMDAAEREEDRLLGRRVSNE